MSAKANSGADGTAADLAEMTSRLESKIEELIEATPENYGCEVEQIEDSELVSVVIDSEESWYNEDELGFMRFHVILGPRGGLRMAHSHDSFTGRDSHYVEECDRVWKAWNLLKSAIKRAD